MAMSYVGWIGWTIFVLISAAVIGIAVTWELRRRRRIAAERREAWEAHETWLRQSELSTHGSALKPQGPVSAQTPPPTASRSERTRIHPG